MAPKRIVRWKAEDDSPDFEEPVARQIAARMSEEERDLRLDNGLALLGEKPGGSTTRVQGAVRPPCPSCSQPMETIFRIDSNDLVDIAWGDAGIAHLFQCAEHPGELAFTRACD